MLIWKTRTNLPFPPLLFLSLPSPPILSLPLSFSFLPFPRPTFAFFSFPSLFHLFFSLSLSFFFSATFYLKTIVLRAARNMELGETLWLSGEKDL